MSLTTQESQHIEFKREWRNELLKWICAFANSDGGTLMIGYNDQGEVVGVENTSKLLEDIPNQVRDVLGIIVEVNLVSHRTLKTLHIKTDAYPYPVSYKGEYHYRSGSTKQELKGAALDKFLMRKQRLPDETLEVSNAELLAKLRLTQGDYLKRAAIMLFHPEPDYFVTGAEIKIGAFGKNDADLLYHDVIHGNLFTQVETALELIQLKYLKAKISYEGLYRKERFPLPIPALREALLNAVVHKDYGSHTAIQISIYPDKLMLWNPGQLPDSWTLEKLISKHESIPYNPEIAKCFFLAGLIEAWGRGIERIIEACQQENYPTPEWKVEPNGLWVIFELEADEKEQETVDYGRYRTISDDIGRLTLEQKLLVEHIIKNDRVTRVSAMELLNLQKSQAAAILKAMVEMGLLARKGQGRGTYYELRQGNK